MEENKQFDMNEYLKNQLGGQGNQPIIIIYNNPQETGKETGNKKAKPEKAEKGQTLKSVFGFIFYSLRTGINMVFGLLFFVLRNFRIIITIIIAVGIIFLIMNPEIVENLMKVLLRKIGFGKLIK